MAAGDLTTLANVRAMLQKATGDTDQDAVISAEITRASAAITTYAQREFAPPVTAAARKFAYTGGGVLYLGSYDLRTVTLMQIDTDGTASTLATTDYKLRPLTPRLGVYTSLLLPNHAASDLFPREVTITGDWGFAIVPADVEEACLLTVVERIRRDVSAFSGSFPEEDGTSPRPIGIPFAARQILDSYRRPLVA